MESSIAEFLKRKLACELLPTLMLSGVVMGGLALCCVACGVCCRHWKWYDSPVCVLCGRLDRAITCSATHQ